MPIKRWSDDRFDNQERTRLDLIERRVATLRRRLEDGLRGPAKAWTEGEVSALRWMVRLLTGDHTRTVGEAIRLERTARRARQRQRT